MANELEYQYAYPQAAVFDAAQMVLTYSPIRLKSADRLLGSIQASTSINMATYGEQITVLVLPVGPNSSVVKIRSRLNFGWSSWGHNRKNVEKLHTQFLNYLQVTSAGTPGWYGDPFGTMTTRYFDGAHWLDRSNQPMPGPPVNLAPTVPSAPTALPAGWHPDPHDAALQRYWDGYNWTDHTAPR